LVDDLTYCARDERGYYNPNLQMIISSERDEDGDYSYEYQRIFMKDIGVEPTDLLIVKYDGNAGELEVNGNSVACKNGWLGGDFFTTYYKDCDEGCEYVRTGTYDGTRLYYVIVRNQNNAIIMEGYADYQTNPATGNKEYCWCWRSSNGSKTYEFAYGTDNPYGGYIHN
ncbi:MAG: hypothetical protein IIU20_07065, partial [Bacteroidales bacterium]|nr:hypothetical protein [Bacteroidales bacterium]